MNVLTGIDKVYCSETLALHFYWRRKTFLDQAKSPLFPHLSCVFPLSPETATVLNLGESFSGLKGDQ